ncbi:MAG: RtcB family protein [bacterium]|nr:RtcB family protein [bacterium]
MENIIKLSEHEWRLDPTGAMKVPVRLFSSPELLKDLEETVFTQAKNVATLPGLVDYSIAMPDAHSGYGFPIGGIGAFDPENGGVICMGGIGFDISCGVRTLTTGLKLHEVMPHLEKLINQLYADIPAGLGVPGEIKANHQVLEEIARGGAAWAVEHGYGVKEDLAHIENDGRLEGADPANVSKMAKDRQKDKMGTLGSGNHYLEVQVVEEIYDQEIAAKWGLDYNSIVITFHCGSRAYGHQIGTDYLKILDQASKKYGIALPDRELVCAPIKSEEGQRFLSAVLAGINCALANRQIIAHLIRQSVRKIFPSAPVATLYDVSHNTAKFEEHETSQGKKRLLVHRKGATRAFKDQPVIIGGSMGTASYLLLGLGDERSFSSCVHGAGRIMSRTKAKRQWFGKKLQDDLEKQGILIRSHSLPGLAEEAPGAYKNIEVVIAAVDTIGLAKKIIKLKPLACVKG